MTLEYVNYIMWATRTNQEYMFIIHAFRLNLGICVELGLIPMWAARPPNSSGNIDFVWWNLHVKYNLLGKQPTWNYPYNSRHYAQELPSILGISAGNTIYS